MSLARKAIWDALEARLAQVPGLITHSQRLRDFASVPEVEQPALFLQPGNQQALNQPGHPTKWTLQADVYVYVYADTDEGPSGQLQTLLDGIEAALEARPDERNPTGSKFYQNGFGTTLGGLVATARITSIETDEGALGPQAVAIVAVAVETVA